jgi:two-component system, NtrC family, response regulator HydG
MNRKLNILIIDDEPMIGKTFKDILIIKGYEADVAHSGEEALEKLKGKKIDCILSDIKMPGMNGLELFAEIRNKGYFIPTILMTAYSTDNLKKAALREGVIAVISKPLDINMLLSFFPCLKMEKVIAIVDDDSNFCNVTGRILELRGFKVIATDPDRITDNPDRDVGVLLLDMKVNHPPLTANVV